MTPLARALVSWFRKHRIAYPWRLTDDAYKIWVSEVLLQQTRISVALPFYERIIRRFPDFESLASASPAEFLAEWSGIGYYRRAQHMMACAERVVHEHEGRFPREIDALRKLPGIGPYTCGAIRNLCFDALTPAIDGNISRVLARITGCATPVTERAFKAALEKAFLSFGEGAPASDYFQSIMELGERICLPQPDSHACPVQKQCVAFAKGLTQQIPARASSRKPQEFQWYFLLLRRNDQYCFVQNRERSFLKDAWLFPDLLSDRVLSRKEIAEAFKERWKINASEFEACGAIRHSVTFRKITGHVLLAKRFTTAGNENQWFSAAELESRHTSSVSRKILNLLSAGA